MILDPGESTAAGHPDCDICIVGAGPIGITLALELAAHGLRVALMESGGETPGTSGQDLTDGTTTGDPYPPLVAARLRGLGGSSGHWGSWCRWPTQVEWTGRPWLSGSGWPVPYDALAPHREVAENWVDLEPGTWEPIDRPSEVEGFLQSRTRFSPPTRFHRKFDRELRESDRIQIRLGTTVTRLITKGDAVREVEFRTATGDRPERLRADTVVIACGGLESARLLLLSPMDHGRPPGDAGGWVGRGLMDHVKVPVLDSIGSPAEFRTTGLFGEPGSKIHLAPREELLREHRLLPCRFEFVPRAEPDFAQDEVFPALGILREALYGTAGTTRGSRVLMRVDPVARRECRIELGTTRDRLGQPQTRVVWSIGDQERRAIERAPILLAAALRSAGIDHCRVSGAPAGSDAVFGRSPVIYGHHHYGTTRMANAPEHGVVDTDARVFGVANLYIAGPGVLPDSAGFPTMIALALARRLAWKIAGVSAPG